MDGHYGTCIVLQALPVCQDCMYLLQFFQQSKVQFIRIGTQIRHESKMNLQFDYRNYSLFKIPCCANGFIIH